MDDVKKDFLICDEKLAWFQGRFAKLQKRAQKLGVPAPSYTIGAAINKEERKLRPGYDEDAAGLVGDLAFITVVRVYHPVVVSGEAPKYAGWAFAATIQHLTEGENIVRAFEDGVPARYRAAKSDCEHCNVYRRRNDTYVVRNEAGAYKQVGSSCIRDFLGHENPERLAAQAEFLADALSLGEGGEDFGGAVTPRADLLSVLTYTMASIRAHGWTSRTKAKEVGFQATANHVWLMLFPYSGEEKREAAAFARNVTAADAEVAQAAMDWALGLDGELGDYLHNCRAIARANVVENRTAGYACSIVPAYNRELAKRAEKAALPESHHLGEIKERIRFQATVVDVRYLEGYMGGATFLFTMRTAEGNDLKWFASQELLAKGSTYDLVGTVKKHDDWKGRKQTVVTRCDFYVEKPKKSAATKKVAQGVVDFVAGLMAPYHIAQGVQGFVQGLVGAYQAYHDQVGWGLQAGFYAITEVVRTQNNAIWSGLERFIKGAREWDARLAKEIGDSIAGFCRWAGAGFYDEEIRSYRNYHGFRHNHIFYGLLPA